MAVLSTPLRRGVPSADRRHLLGEEADGCQGGLSDDAVERCGRELRADHFVDGDDVSGGRHGVFRRRWCRAAGAVAVGLDGGVE